MNLISYLKSSYKNYKNSTNSQQNNHIDVQVSFNLDNLEPKSERNIQELKDQKYKTAKDKTIVTTSSDIIDSNHPEFLALEEAAMLLGNSGD